MTSCSIPQPPRRVDVAAVLDLARRDWRVFPLRPGDKRPATPTHPIDACTGTDPWCSRAGRHLGWQDRATTDPERITRAWSSPTPFGVGIACGPSGLLVIDLDPPDGPENLARLAEDTGNTLPPTFTVRTPRGGTHLYYTRPIGPRLANTASTLADHVDTRGIGGYVVAPPTAINGTAYTITDDRPPVLLPTWLTTRLRNTAPPPAAPAGPVRLNQQGTGRRGAYLRSAVDAETTRVREATGEGTRNHTLLCAAIALGQLVAGGELTAGEVHEALMDAAAGHLAAGAYTRSQAEATIRSGLRRGATRPRRLGEAA